MFFIKAINVIESYRILYRYMQLADPLKPILIPDQEKCYEDVLFICIKNTCSSY